MEKEAAMLAYVIAVLAFSIAIEIIPFALERLICGRSVTPSGGLDDVDHCFCAEGNTREAGYRSEDLLQQRPCKGLCGQAGARTTQ